MRLTIPQPLSPQDAPENARWITWETALRWTGLAAILILAAVLRFANLEAIGYGNPYYTAAVKSMLQSWHNFFFAAAEPGGSVSVDKPPVGLWLQAISAYFLGVNGFAVVLPQILAGLLSVAVLDHLVRRAFGTAAGLLAALALAVTPVVIATDRNNTIDSTLILTLLLAAWAFIKATETTRPRYLLLGAALVGIGFNIKMLQAYLPLPAFYALYLLGSAERFWRKAGKLALATVLLLAISLSWALAVDLTPADQRPYVGSSGDNSELSLILGYNGVNRLLGMFHRGGIIEPTNPGGGGAQPPPAGMNAGPQSAPGSDGSFRQPGGFPQPGSAGDGGGFSPPGGDRAGRGPFAGRAGPGGAMDTGQPGALRLFIPPLSKEVSWLLPFGLLSVLLVAWRGPKRGLLPPLAVTQQSLVLWSGWLLTCVVFFSIAGFFHEYYLSMLAAPLAALVAAGAVRLWELRAQRPWLAAALLLVGAGVTLGFQVYTAQAFTNAAGWLPLTLAVFAAGALLLAGGTILRLSSPATAGFALVLLALFITPGVWSGLTAFAGGGSQTLPAAYGGASPGMPGLSRETFGADNPGGLQVDQGLLAYLEQNTAGMKYLMAVPSSMDGASYVLATGRPVLYMGGFNGQDPVVDATDLSNLVAAGQLRYIWGESRVGPGGQTGISAWVASQCMAVSGLSTAGGSSSAGRGGFDPSGGGRLYDCGH